MSPACSSAFISFTTSLNPYHLELTLIWGTAVGWTFLDCCFATAFSETLRRGYVEVPVLEEAVYYHCKLTILEMLKPSPGNGV